ncbi:MAG: hypothetical protein V7K92_29650 [Nostoc sp.]
MWLLYCIQLRTAIFSLYDPLNAKALMISVACRTSTQLLERLRPKRSYAAGFTARFDCGSIERSLEWVGRSHLFHE